MDSIAVGMITRNSSSTLQANFIRVLRRIKQEIPFYEFIVADDSTDDTIAVIRQMIPGVLVLTGGGTRGRARQAVIDCTKGEWLMFVDDDVLLQSGWMKRAEALMTETVGMIYGCGIGLPGEHLDSEGHYQRLGTHDTLLRMDALKGIKIPPFLNWLEDMFITRHVYHMGYEARLNSVGFENVKTYNDIASDVSGSSGKAYYECCKFMGVYRREPIRALATLAGTPKHISKRDEVSIRDILVARLSWFRAYAGLY